ncbi:MAG: PIN domain-containing protein [Pseudonocardiaceae bacterium]|nr:PIN domain-containing protein [Pseudonocardiaceae bacterium]
MDAFDADVLIYAAAPGHPLGRRVAALFPTDPPAPDDPPTGIGSVLLLPEVLSRPMRRADEVELTALGALLGRLELWPLDAATAELATALGATYGLRAADAVHLATAVAAGSERFLTDNRRDFSHQIDEVVVIHPDELPDPDE